MFKVVLHFDGKIAFERLYFTYKEARKALNDFSTVLSNAKAEGSIHDYYVDLIKEGCP